MDASNNRLSDLLGQYQELSQIESYEKLAINTTTGNLQRTSGSGLARNFKWYLNSTDPTYEKVIGKMNDLRRSTSELIDNYSEKKDLLPLGQELKVAAEKIALMATTSYTKPEDLKKQGYFLKISKEIEGLANQILSDVQDKEIPQDLQESELHLVDAFEGEPHVNADTNFAALAEMDESDFELGSYEEALNQGSPGQLSGLPILSNDSSLKRKEERQAPEEEANLEESEWLELNPDNATQAVDNKPFKYQGGILNMPVRAANTAMGYVWGKVNPDYQANHFPQDWEQFGSVATNRYLNSLVDNYEKAHGVKPIKIEYISMNRDINRYTLDDIIKNIKSEISQELKGEKLDRPVIIPISIQGNELIGRNHIVSVIIKDGKLEYFDPMGTPSNHVQLADGSTLADVFVRCQKEYELSEVIENPIQVQHDIHNCGAFSCNFFKRRLEGELLGSLAVGMEPSNVRKEIFNSIMAWEAEFWKKK